MKNKTRDTPISVRPWLDGKTIFFPLACGALLITISSLAYYFIPLVTQEACLKFADGSITSNFLDCFYFSIATATTLGYGDIYPKGYLKIVASAEVLLGIIIAGISVNQIVNRPEYSARKVLKKCKGWWIESCAIPGEFPFFSIGFININGKSIIKEGSNYNPASTMHGVTFYGEVITLHFPKLFSIYEEGSDTLYSKGVYRFEFDKPSLKTCDNYSGYCYDHKYGCRDTITGKRITDDSTIQQLETQWRDNSSFSDILSLNIVSAYFPDIILNKKYPATCIK